jgi:hypothetical protein
MGDDGAGVVLEMVPSATPPHARNAPSSRPKGDGDKREALPYAPLLSQVQVGVTMEPRWTSCFRRRPLVSVARDLVLPPALQVPGTLHTIFMTTGRTCTPS